MPYASKFATRVTLCAPFRDSDTSINEQSREPFLVTGAKPATSIVVCSCILDNIFSSSSLKLSSSGNVKSFFCAPSIPHAFSYQEDVPIRVPSVYHVCVCTCELTTKYESPQYTRYRVSRFPDIQRVQAKLQQTKIHTTWYPNGPLRGHGFDMGMIFASRPHVRGSAWVVSYCKTWFSKKQCKGRALASCKGRLYPMQGKPCLISIFELSGHQLGNRLKSDALTFQSVSM